MQEALRTAAAVCLAGALLAAGPAAADDLAASLKARITFSRLDGTALAIPAAGEPFAIAVTLTDALTGASAQPPGGLIAWFRRVSKGNPDCKTAVRMYLATEASLPRGTTRLHGLLFASATETGEVVFLDPNFRLASADLVKAYSLPAPPADLIWHAARRQLIASDSSRGTLTAITPLGGLDNLASGLNRPSDLEPAPDGGLWVAEEGSGRVLRLDQTGKAMAAITTAPGAIVLRRSGHLIAALSAAGVIVADSVTGAIVREDAAASGSRDLAMWSDSESSLFASLSSGGDSVRITYLDAGASEIKLATTAARLAISPDGRFLFAFDAAEPGVSIIDLAEGRLIQGLAFASGIAEVSFIAGTAFLRLADGSQVMRIPLASLAAGKAAEVGRVWLGPANPSDLGQDKGLLVPIEASDSMLAVHIASGLALPLSAKTGMANALGSTGFKLRGGLPRQVLAIDIGFTAGPDGIFSNSAVLPAGGDYELILSTGPTGFSDCVKVHASGAPPPEVVDVALVAESGPALRAGKVASVDFALLDGEAPVTLSRPPRLLLTSLGNGWRDVIGTRLKANGFTADLILPSPGLYVLVPLDLPPQLALKAASQVEVME